MKAVVCVTNNWAIGKNGGLIAHIKEDMEWFKSLTAKNVVYMGKNTWLSLPGDHTLPNRRMVVFTHEPHVLNIEAGSSDLAFTNFDDFMHLYRLGIIDRKGFIIGGAQIYKQTIENGMVKTAYVTKLPFDDTEADAFFPNLDEMGWKKEKIKTLHTDTGDIPVYAYQKR